MVGSSSSRSAASTNSVSSSNSCDQVDGSSTGLAPVGGRGGGGVLGRDPLPALVSFESLKSLAETFSVWVRAVGGAKAKSSSLEVAGEASSSPRPVDRRGVRAR
jgi:hypothetical protein